MTDRIPLTVLGGWLGAGKTTMLNRLLSASTERLAVIVNDVGDINVDAELIRKNVDPENAQDGVIELTNGCVCCKIGDDLFATVAELSRRSPAPERIVLEASGVADLRPITTYVSHPSVTVDAVLALAEGTGFAYRSSGPPYGSLMRAQLAGADLVLATKLDLVDQADHDAALDELRQFTKAPVLAASADPAWLRAVVLGVHDNPDREVTRDDSTPTIATATWEPKEPTSTSTLKRILSTSNLARAKGSVETDTGPVVVHLAGGRVEITERNDTAAPLNAIVLIGEQANVDATIRELGQKA